MTRQQTLILLALTTILVIGITLYFILPTSIEKPKTITIETPLIEEPIPIITTKIIGTSVAGRDITAFSFGNGGNHILFVGGMHGGYEWNSSLLAYKYISYLKENIEQIPSNLTIDIIPTLNPDGLFKVTKKTGEFTLTDVINPSVRLAEGRFNTNKVDLNRNFDCKWAPKSTWRGKTVSAGGNAFSEPETIALRDFVTTSSPKAVIFWHSRANNVYASECTEGILPATLTLMNTYADAAGYGKVESFTAYPITGDAEGWLASINIPAITVELKGFQTSEWKQNIAGINETLLLYTTKK